MDVPNIVFSSKEVGKADAFAINLLCPFQFDATGLESILEMAEVTNRRLDWLSIRPGTEDRKVTILTEAKGCGEEESIFADRYEAFKKNLLPE
ncbi:MAG: hypothetical protein AAFO94_10780 [Bacteroidota bacterium]